MYAWWLLTGLCGVPMHGEAGVRLAVVGAEPHVEPIVRGDDIAASGCLSAAEPADRRCQDIGAVVQLPTQSR